MNEEEDDEVETQNSLIRLVSEKISQPEQRPFYLFAADTTPHPRPYAKTLPERGYIYQPNTIKGNKPINIGHRIISQIGKPGHSPKTRGNSSGRVTGHTQPKRDVHPVVKKQSKSTPTKQKAA